jgi:glycosyltransferase involved in cell wall biosynthesis
VSTPKEPGSRSGDGSYPERPDMTVPLESLFSSQESQQAEQGYPGQAYPGEQPYKDQRVYPGEPQPYQQQFRYQPPQPYESAPGYDPAPNYDPGQGYDPAPNYDPGQGYDPAQGYDPDPGYDSGRAYEPSRPYEPEAPASYQPAQVPPPYQSAPPAPYEPAAPAPYEPQAPYEPEAPRLPRDPFQTQPPQSRPQAPSQAEPARYEPPLTYQPQYQVAPADGREPRVSIVLPCYNEQDHVLIEVERISRSMDDSGLPYELLAIDDASTDATMDRLRLAEPHFPRLRVIHFPRNGGSGTVRRIGTQQAKGDIVVWTDADMSYPNERIPELVAMLDADPTIDQVVGARTSEEGTHKVARVPAKWFIRKLAERLTNTEIPDLNSGLRAFRRSVAGPYLRLLPPGFSCTTTITLAFLSNEHGVHYVPIDYAKRAGVSKFHFFSDAYRYVLQVLRMVMYFNPLKVLMPPALFLIVLGGLKAIYDLVVHPLHFANDTILIFVTGLIIASLALLADLIVRSRGDT